MNDATRRPFRNAFMTLATAALVFSLLYPAPAPAQTATQGARVSTQPSQTLPIQPGERIGREIKGGEVQSYDMSLEAQYFLSITVEPQDARLVTTLFDPSGMPLIEIPDTNGTMPPIFWVASTPGTYKLYVRSISADARGGSYILTIDDYRTSTPQDQKLVARELNYIGILYFNYNDHPKALDHYNRALNISRSIADKEGEAYSLYNIGVIYETWEDHSKALDYIKQSARLFHDLGIKRWEAENLRTIGMLQTYLRDYDSALNNLEASLPLFRDVHDRDGEARALNNLASLYSSLGANGKAIEYYKQALKLSNNGVPPGDATVLGNIGALYLEEKDYEAALHYLNLALSINRQVGYQHGEVWNLEGLMRCWKALENPRLSVFYGKQAVNVIQELRASIQGLGKETQKQFLSSNEHTYRFLANVLISLGRLPEAEQVLSLLKEEEYSGLRRRSEKASAVGYSSTEAQAIEVLTRLAALARERGELAARKEKKTLDMAGLARLRQIDEILIPKANDEYNRAFEAIKREAPDDAVKTAEVENAQALMKKLGQMGPGTVALYTVISAEQGRSTKGWIIFVMPPKVRKAFVVDVSELDKTVLDLRLALDSPARDPRPAAQKLYRILFQTPQPEERGGTTLEADLETYLKGQKERTLMWSLDGVLRYVPVAVLSPDGEHYMVERFRNVVFTPASIPTLSDPVSRDWHVLGLGVSKAYKFFDEATHQEKTFDALSGVPLELAAIVRDKGTRGAGALPGVKKLDEQFKADSLLGGLEGFPVVHIASHFYYDPDNQEKSFLLLGGGGRLEMSTIKNGAQIFDNTELLTLSACDTAMGSSKDANGKDAEALAYVAQDQGAKSVIASLWPVDDIGTQVLMPKFYSLRQSGMSKAEALRRAQLALLDGEVTKDATRATGRSADILGADGVGATNAPTFKADPQRPFAHPYYWAPFILIGNWK